VSSTSSVSGSSISGLASGIDTSSIITQLMQVESQPQTNLKNKVTAEQSIITAYQSVNTRMKALQTAADTLTQLTAWQAATATSSSPGLAVTAAAGAPSGSYNFDVTALAKAQVTTAVVPSSGAITNGGGLDISINGAAPTHINITTDTAADAATAINSANVGVQAMVVNTDQGTVLQLSATKTGTANSFAISGLNATPITQTAAADAQIAVGDPAAGGYTVTSSSNSFTNLIPNVTLTATQIQSGVTVTVASNSASIANQMQAMVDAANAALTEIGNQTTYTPAATGSTAAGKAGPLLSDLGVQDLQGNILSAVSAGSNGYGSFSQLGVQLDKDGQYTFDRNAFLAAYAADPTKVQNAVQNSTDGLATKLKSVADKATDFTTGTLTTAIQGANDYVSSLNTEIDGWTTRLQDKQAALQQQFTAMETALGKLKDQSNWLSGQLASLPSTSSA
jgi:flagellar hook-associated protein 2